MGEEIGRDTEFYYCLKHGTVEREDGCRAADRLGPFQDEQSAAHALEVIHEREERKAAEDRAWRDED